MCVCMVIADTYEINNCNTPVEHMQCGTPITWPHHRACHTTSSRCVCV